jgi:uncharacterized protein (UPF0276 family)
MPALLSPNQSEIFAAGAGLRPKHYPELLNRRSTIIEWFEIITENFLTTKGRPHWVLKQIRQDYPIAFHGVSLSIGSPEPLDYYYLAALKVFIKEFEPFLVSDHFCWTGLHHNNSHNLLPLPASKTNLDYLVPRIQEIQDYLGRQVLFENASAYMQMEDDEMSEWEFISEVCRRSGCGLLLDLNNLYVTCRNFNRDLKETFNEIPVSAVKQIHLAGHTDCETYLFDTHSTTVPNPVWQLFDEWLQTKPAVPTMIEWDEDIPNLATLEKEVALISDHHSRIVRTSLSDQPQEVWNEL